MEDRQPLITDLFEERQKALNPNGFPSGSKEQQAYNPSDAQRALYPDRSKTMNMGEFGE